MGRLHHAQCGGEGVDSNFVTQVDDMEAWQDSNSGLMRKGENTRKNALLRPNRWGEGAEAAQAGSPLINGLMVERPNKHVRNEENGTCA